MQRARDLHAQLLVSERAQVQLEVRRHIVARIVHRWLRSVVS
jgi:hypothetical protein